MTSISRSDIKIDSNIGHALLTKPELCFLEFRGHRKKNHWLSGIFSPKVTYINNGRLRPLVREKKYAQPLKIGISKPFKLHFTSAWLNCWEKKLSQRLTCSQWLLASKARKRPSFGIFSFVRWVSCCCCDVVFDLHPICQTGWMTYFVC